MTKSKNLKVEKKPSKKSAKKKTKITPKERKVLVQNVAVPKTKKPSNLKVLGTLQVSIFIFVLTLFN